MHNIQAEFCLAYSGVCSGCHEAFFFLYSFRLHCVVVRFFWFAGPFLLSYFTTRSHSNSKFSIIELRRTSVVWMYGCSAVLTATNYICQGQWNANFYTHIHSQNHASNKNPAHILNYYVFISLEEKRKKYFLLFHVLKIYYITTF